MAMVMAMAYERHKMGVEFNDGVASAIVNEWEEDNEEEMQALADKMKGLKGDWKHTRQGRR